MLRFDRYVLDPSDARLLRDGAPVHVTPKALHLLRRLAEAAGHLVTRDELFAAVWPDARVTDDALARCVAELRRALGDDARAPRFIATVHRRGFRFLMRVHGAARRPDLATFVGREAELRRAREALAQAAAGRGSAIWIAGEPGVGKTRLVGEIIRCGSGAYRVVSGSATGAGGDRPFSLWTPVVRELAGALGATELARCAGADLPDLAELVPEIREQLGAIQRRPDLSADEARFRVYDAVSHFLVRSAEHAPLLLVLEDLHAADSDSLQLLREVGRAIAIARIALFGTFRDVGGARNASLAELWAASDPSARVPLGGLARSEVQELLGQFSDPETAARLCTPVHERSGGNPLFVQELSRLLADSGDSDLAWSETPETIGEALAARLSALSQRARDALSLAAVAGPEFSLALLAGCGALAEGQLEAGIREAEAERLVARDGGAGRARFVHGLLREVTYKQLREGVRARLHRRIAAALESTAAPGGGAPVSELAHHYGHAMLGGDPEKAIHYATLAGDQALAQFAVEKAAIHYGAALDALEAVDPPDFARLADAALRCARAEFAADRVEPARELSRRAAGHARASQLAGRMAEAAIAFAGMQPAYERSAEASAALREALAALGPSALAARARVLAQLGLDCFLRGESLEHETLSRESIAIARVSGEPLALLDALSTRSHAFLHPSRELEWQATYREAISLARELANLPREFEARLHQLEHDQQLALPEAIERDLAELARLAEQLRTPSPRATLLRARAGLAIARADLPEAWRIAQQAIALGQRTDSGLARMVSLLQLGSILDYQARSAILAPEIEEVGARTRGVSLLQAGVVFALVARGEREGARERLDELLASDLAALPRDASFAVALSNLTLSCTRLGYSAGAERLREGLLPYAGRVLTLLSHYPAGCASRFLGLLATQLECWDEATEHFESALRVDRRMGARGWEACVLVDHARMLRTRRAAGDLNLAASLLEAALAIAAPLGILRLEREARALLAAA